MKYKFQLDKKNFETVIANSTTFHSETEIRINKQRVNILIGEYDEKEIRSIFLDNKLYQVEVEKDNEGYPTGIYIDGEYYSANLLKIDKLFYYILYHFHTYPCFSFTNKQGIFVDYTIDRFFKWNQNIDLILILPENQIDHWKNMVATNNYPSNYSICKGGKERFDSVKNGLDLLENELIMIHDGVRPLVSSPTLDRCLDTANTSGSAIPVVSINKWSKSSFIFIN